MLGTYLTARRECRPHFQDTTLHQVMRGRLLVTGEATCNHGAELDVGVVSRSLEALTTFTPTWEVPWKPHAGLGLRVRQQASEWEAWKLPQFPKLGQDSQHKNWVEAQPPTFAPMDKQCQGTNTSTWNGGGSRLLLLLVPPLLLRTGFRNLENI